MNGKLIRIGKDSAGLILPKNELKNFNWKSGTEVSVHFNPADKSVIVKEKAPFMDELEEKGGKEVVLDMSDVDKFLSFPVPRKGRERIGENWKEIVESVSCKLLLYRIIYREDVQRIRLKNLKNSQEKYIKEYASKWDFIYDDDEKLIYIPRLVTLEFPAKNDLPRVFQYHAQQLFFIKNMIRKSRHLLEDILKEDDEKFEADRQEWKTNFLKGRKSMMFLNREIRGSWEREVFRKYLQFGNTHTHPWIGHLLNWLTHQYFDILAGLVSVLEKLRKGRVKDKDLYKKILNAFDFIEEYFSVCFTFPRKKTDKIVEYHLTSEELLKIIWAYSEKEARTFNNNEIKEINEHLLRKIKAGKISNDYIYLMDIVKDLQKMAGLISYFSQFLFISADRI